MENICLKEIKFAGQDLSDCSPAAPAHRLFDIDLQVIAG